MRVASRIIGVALALAGLVFLGLSVFIVAGGFDRRSVLVESGPDRTGWISGAITAALGVFFLLAGWHYLKLDVDQIDDANNQPASRFAPYFISHRREFKLIAQIGLVISLIRLGAACFGVDWPGRWAAWALALVWIGLLVIGRQIAEPPTMGLDWQTVPERLRPVLKAAVNLGRAAFVILLLAFVWNQWSHHQAPPRVVNNGFLPLFFAWEALFFAYGEVKDGSREIGRAHV